MKSSKLFWLVTALILLVSLVGCTATGDRILLKERGADNRCHMKIERSGDPTTLSNREVISVSTGPVMNGLIDGIFETRINLGGPMTRVCR